MEGSPGSSDSGSVLE